MAEENSKYIENCPTRQTNEHCFDVPINLPCSVEDHCEFCPTYKSLENVEKQKDDYSKDKNFWKRLKSFVEDIEVSDAWGYEEKEMILHVCNEKI